MLALLSSTTPKLSSIAVAASSSVSASSLRQSRSAILTKRHWIATAVVAVLSLSSSSTTTLALHPSSSSSRTFFTMSSNTFTTERTDSVITVSNKDETKQSALIVIAHGLGDSAEGFVDVAEMFAGQLPHVKFVLPTAPVQPVTLNGGMRMTSWYDIVGLDERSSEKCDGIQQSQQMLRDILRKEHESIALPYSRMMLAGFSQGGALSLYTGLQLGQEQDGTDGDTCADQEERLAGIVVMSGYLPAAKQVKVTPGLETTPIFQAHGTQDMVVPYIMAEKSKMMLEHKLGVSNVVTKTYPIGHTVSPAELADVLAFIKQHLPEETDFKVKLKDPATMSIKELKAAIRKAGLSQQAMGFMEKSEFVKLLQEHRSKS